MKDVQIQKKYFIGRSSKGVWSTVYAYKPHNPQLKLKRGEIFAVILLRGPEGFSLGTAGGLLLDRFHEAYFENKDDSVLVALEKAAIETSKFLQKILENDKADKEGIDLNLISLVILNDLIYTLSLGDGKIFVHREDELNDISSQLKDPTGEGYFKEASFVAKRGDVYLLGTPLFEKELLKQDLTQAVEDFTDLPFKNRMFEQEEEVALIMIGYNKERKAKVLLEPVAVEKQNIEEVSTAEKQSIDEVSAEEKAEVVAVDDEKTLADVIAEEKEMESAMVEPEEEHRDSEGFHSQFMDEENVETEPLPPASEEDMEEIMEEADEISELEENIEPAPAPRLAKPNFIKNLFSSISQKFKREPSLSRQQQIETGNEAELKTYQVVLLKIRKGISSFFTGIKSLVWDKWLGLGMNTDDVYLRSAARKRRYGFLAILIILVIAVLYYSINGAVENQKQKEAEELAMARFNEISIMIDAVEEQAKYLAAASGADERKVKALNDLTTAESALTELEGNANLADELLTANARIVSIRNKFNRIIALNDVQLLSDLGDNFPNATPSDIDINNQKVYVADSKYGTIYSFDYSGNNRAELASGFTNPKSLSVDTNNNTLLVLDDSPDNALSIVNLGNNTVSRMAASSLSKLSGTTQIETAIINGAEPRLYLMNPANKSISYYIRTGSNYGTLVQRNTNDDLASATDLKVDEGRIYFTMQKNSGLFKDFQKQEDPINIQGMAEGDNFLNATALYVDGLYVYIADPVNKRVLVFSKGAPDITLIAQYVYQGQDANLFKNIREIVADRNANKLFVLDGSKILVLDMNLLLDFTIN